MLATGQWNLSQIIIDEYLHRIAKFQQHCESLCWYSDICVCIVFIKLQNCKSNELQRSENDEETEYRFFYFNRPIFVKMASFGEEDTIPGGKDDMIPKNDDMIPKTDDMIPTWTESETKSPKAAPTTKKVVSTSIEESSHKCPQCDKTVFRVEQLLCAGKYWHKTCFQCGGRGGRGCGRKLTSTNCSVQEGTFDDEEHTLYHDTTRSIYHSIAIRHPCFYHSHYSHTLLNHTLSPRHQGEPYCRNCYGQFLVKTASNEEAIRAADSGQARKEMPSLLAGVKVSERANLFLGGGHANGAGLSPGGKGLGGAAQSNKCVHCGKSVYPAEELRAQSMLWHKACFTCGALSEVGCHRVLPKVG